MKNKTKNYIIQHQSYSAVDIVNKSRKHKIWYDTQEEHIQIAPPNNKKLSDTFEKYPMEFYPSPGYVCELQDCHIVGENAVGLYQGKELILETSGCRINDLYTGPHPMLAKHALKSLLGDKPQESKKSVFPLICPDPSYYHWMIEYLPKLRMLELYEKETGSKPTVLIEPNPRDFVRNTLECAGYDSNHREEWNEQSAIIEDLILATHRPRVFNYQTPQLSKYEPSFNDLNWLRDRMRSGQFNSSINPPKRVYISRQNAARGRKVVNFEEVNETLEKYDFGVYELENYGFREQLDIFKKSNLIVGPHGAGLLNMIFSTDPTVIELFPKTVLKPHFYFLSSIFGFEYEAMIAESEGNDLIVNTERLSELINEKLFN